MGKIAVRFAVATGGGLVFYLQIPVMRLAVDPHKHLIPTCEKHH